MHGPIIKQPNDRIDFDVDFNEFLALRNDTIDFASAVSDDPGLAIISVSHSAGKVKVWIEGGENAASYKVTVTITTIGDRHIEDEIRVRIREV